MQKTIYILHGFRSNQSSTEALARHLEQDYQVITPDLAISFQKLDVAVRALQKIIATRSNEGPLVFIGHSTGGLLIRRMLNSCPDIARRTTDCIFIATPNHGTPLAEIHQKLPGFLRVIHTPIAELTQSAIESLNLQKPDHIRFAGICGTEPHPVTNRLFRGSENDGVVAKRSVAMESMQSFVSIKANHVDIMSDPVCLIQVAHFLKSGCFSR